MACGCRKGRTGAVKQGELSPLSDVARGHARSRVQFFVTVNDVEHQFGSLRDARMFANEHGVAVEPRRVSSL